MYFSSDDTWTATDGGALLDIGTETADGHFAIEMWVYVPTATSAVASLLVRGNEATTGFKLAISSAGKVVFTIKDGTVACTITSTKSVFGGWHLITVVGERDSETGLNMYIDGVADATAVDTKSMNDAINPETTLVITGVSNKDMWVGPLGLYTGASAALTAAKVLENYNEGIGRKYHGAETGLALAWNNDEGVGTACYEIGNNAGYVAAISGATWSPTKQSGATAAVSKCGPPFEKANEDDADDPLGTIGLFTTGILVATDGVMEPISVTFPQAIRIGKNNPVRILETNGSFSLLLFGNTGK